MKDTDNDLTSLYEVYRISTSPKKISETLKKSKEMQQSIMWQTHNGEKIIFPLKIEEFDAKESKLIAYYKTRNELIDPHLPVFVKLFFRETLFKGTIERIEGNKLFINVPKEIHVREYRNSLRVRFLPDEEWAEIKILNPNVPSHRIGILKTSLKDISSRGLGFTISKSNAHLFQKGQVLEVLGFSKVKLKFPIIGIVVYSQKDVTPDRKIVYKVGVELQTSINQESFNLIIKNKREILQTSSDHLLNFFTEDFREHILTEIKRTLVKLKYRPALKDFIEAIELNSSNNYYYLEHIKILTIVCIYLGKTVDWPNWISVEKLTCAAYLHDIPFLQMPRLAKIQHLKEFEILKNQLSDQEQQTFLDSPKLALEIVKKDSDSFELVQEMIFHQKERPQGDGFPQGLKASEIPYHSALFIMAQDLTHEILMNFDWTLERWLLKVKDIYNDGHFKEIFSKLIQSKNKLVAHVYSSDSV